MKTELVWEGEHDEYSKRRPMNLVEFPVVMQKIAKTTVKEAQA